LNGLNRGRAVSRYSVEKLKVLRGGRLKRVESKRIEFPVELEEFSTARSSFLSRKAAVCTHGRDSFVSLDALCEADNIHDNVAFVSYCGSVDLRLICGMEKLLSQNPEVRLLLEFQSGLGAPILEITRYLLNRNFVAQVLSNGKLGRFTVSEQSLRVWAEQQRFSSVVFASLKT
jgi:hypothetical protein